MLKVLNFGKRTANRKRGVERRTRYVRPRVLPQPTLGGARWDYNAWLDNRNSYLLP